VIQNDVNQESTIKEVSILSMKNRPWLVSNYVSPKNELKKAHNKSLEKHRNK
jgi:hypothetical protein